MVLVLASYGVPLLHPLRPWLPGDAVPLSRLFDRWQEVPGFAGAGGAYRSGDQDRDRLADQIGAHVAAHLGDQDDVDTEPTPNASQRVAIAPREYGTLEVHIEDPGHRGLAPFFDALRASAREEPNAITRVGHWGDSSIALDGITSTLRRRFQRRFGDAGHGFVLIAKGHMPYRHLDIDHRASEEGWDLKEVVKNNDRASWYGYGGVQYRLGPGAWARWRTVEEGPVGKAVSRFELYYQANPRGGDVRMRVDDGEYRVLSTRADAPEDRIETIEVPDGPHELELGWFGHGQPRLYGLVMERDRPGVVYDSLGLVGARANRLLRFDEPHLARQLELRRPDLIVLGFGGNEAEDDVRLEAYTRTFSEVIRRMRAGRPEAGCLIVAPLDQANRSRRGIETLPSVPIIVEAQRRAAKQRGCAFFDTFEAMGGEGAMRRWYQARPRLALGDLRHATPAGYQVVGNMIYAALLERFAGWLEDQRERPASADASASASAGAPSRERRPAQEVSASEGPPPAWPWTLVPLAVLALGLVIRAHRLRRNRGKPHRSASPTSD